ncbi:LPD28 domain-containing protein [Paenibacillus periandrae]|uniref:LPD28 domain-containing protein n=1 Tax=Paenibacillus periandrae TaxID=1761741 RepID=UPI001F094E8E|nr:LPD28 domain-containing protein [Paenibacillus periandrae]
MVENKYVLFEFEGITCVVKKSPFTREEHMNGFYYYDLEHEDDDDYFPARIKQKACSVNYWGALMTNKPLVGVDCSGSIDLFDLDEDEEGEEIFVPHENFVTNVHFYDLNFYYQESANNIISKSTDFHSIMKIWECIDPHFYVPEEMKMDRVWSMPNANPYLLGPVKELLREELRGGFTIDPFANQSKWAHVTNDLNPNMSTNFHLDAYEFLKLFDDESVDVVLFEPPYSPRQIKELYESVGLDTLGGTRTQASYWSNLKKEIARVLRVGGKAISFGWNSGGMNNKKLFHINRIRLVPHGGAHNDTIITVSVKI